MFAKISSRKNISNSLFAKFSSRENKVLYSSFTWQICRSRAKNSHPPKWNTSNCNEPNLEHFKLARANVERAKTRTLPTGTRQTRTHQNWKTSNSHEPQLENFTRTSQNWNTSNSRAPTWNAPNWNTSNSHAPKLERAKTETLQSGTR